MAPSVRFSVCLVSCVTVPVSVSVVSNINRATTITITRFKSKRGINMHNANADAVYSNTYRLLLTFTSTSTYRMLILNDPEVRDREVGLL